MSNNLNYINHGHENINYGPDTILISANHLKKIKSSYNNDIDEISVHILNIIRENNISLFIPIDSIDHAYQSFESMINYDSSKIIKRNKSKNLNHIKFYASEKKLSNASSNHFHEQDRINSVLKGKISTQSAYDSNSHLLQVLKEILCQIKDTQPISRRTLKDYTEKLYPAIPQFPPLTAKYIIDNHTTIGGRVLDINCLWGDKLSGFLASEKAESYVGMSSCLSEGTVENYINQIDQFSLNDEKEVSIIFDKCESYDYSSFYDEGGFDLVFSSPERFDYQSHDYSRLSAERYNKFDDWKNKYLKRTLVRAWNALNVNGYMVIHTSNYRKDIDITGFLMSSIKNQLRPMEMPTIGIEVSHGERKTIEPMFVWKKITK